MEARLECRPWGSWTSALLSSPPSLLTQCNEHRRDGGQVGQETPGCSCPVLFDERLLRGLSCMVRSGCPADPPVRWLKEQKSISPRSGARKSKIKAPTGLVSGRAPPARRRPLLRAPEGAGAPVSPPLPAMTPVLLDLGLALRASLALITSLKAHLQTQSVGVRARHLHLGSGCPIQSRTGLIQISPKCGQVAIPAPLPQTSLDPSHPFFPISLDSP